MAFRRTALLLLAAWGLTASAPGAPAAYRLVVNPANAAASLTRSEAARLFLKKVAAWPDGRPVAVVDQERGSAVRQAFSRDVHLKDAEAVAAYWQTLVFSGRDVPPPVAKSDAEVLAFVRQNPGGLGYVSATVDLEGVKVLALR